MKKIYFYSIISNLLNIIISVIPLWNFENSTFDLLTTENNYSYQIYSNIINGRAIKLEKNILRNQSSIIETNIITIDSNNFEVEWEDIESTYEDNQIIYICPKGKFHIYKYQGNSLNELKPNDFSFKDDWDLKCFFQNDINSLFVGYLYKNNIFYSYNFNDLRKITNIHSGLYDFKWTSTTIGNNDYPMILIILISGVIQIRGYKFTLTNSNTINCNGISSSPDIITVLNNSNAKFNKDNHILYFMTYNKTDFYSGYSRTENLDYTNVANIEIINNKDSPLDFYYNFTIKQMNFSKNAKYIFYEIYNNEKNKTYHGIIDITINKVIFNTDEIIKSFKPFSNNSMLAITEKSAYKICALSDNNNCIEKCSGNKIFIDSQHPNFCGVKCSNYILLPNEICIKDCDENIFYTNDSYHCGFCIHMNNTHPFKLLNSSGCLNSIPEGTYLYNEKYKLLKKGKENNKADALCNKNEGLYPFIYNNSIGKEEIKCLKKDKEYKGIFFDTKNEKYKQCYETCRTCNQTGNKTFHNCLSCDYGYKTPEEYLPKSNCVPNCKYYYYNAYMQYKCVDKLPCPLEANLFIKEKNKCIDDCKRDNKYKLKYNQNCYEICPNNTKQYNYICKKINNDKFTININNMNIDYNSFIDNLDDLVKKYSEEFSDTNNHVNQYKNKEYNSIIFKNKSCIKELNLDFPTIDFGNCYNKILEENNIENLITVILDKKDDDNNPSTSYSFYDPNSGEKIVTNEICKNDKILVIENILSFLNQNSSYHQSLLNLIEQGINIFNISGTFFTNLCYEYNFPTDKDIALQDRIKIFFPNISLCDSECTISQINIENKTAHCECSFKDIIVYKNNSKINKIEKALIDNLFGDVFDFFDKSNIAVIKCVKKALRSIKKSYGIYIVLSLLFITIIFSIIYFSYGIKQLMIYIYENLENYLKFIENSTKIINQPPLKHSKNENTNKKICKNSNKKNTGICLKNNKIRNLNINISISKENNSRTNKSSSMRLNNKISKIFSENNFKSKKNDSKRYLKNQRYKKYFEEYFSTPIEEMDYDDAIKKDKRKFHEFFLDNLKDKQIILNTFISYEPFKPRPIKIILFCLSLFLYFVIIALFINDDYISKVYYLKEKENFFGFIPRTFDRIVYTTFISIIIEFIVAFLFIEEKKLKGIFLREKNNKKNIKEEIIILVILIKKTFLFFIISVFIIYIICFFYLLCFNSVYPLIQIEWIKSSFFIFFLRQIISVFQCLLETILRYISFSCESERIFKSSKLVN